MTGLNDNADIPLWWRELLIAVQAVCPTAVIAGGCLRDRDNGREVKDIDIFIRAHAMQVVDGHIAAFRKAGFEIDFAPSEKTAYPEDQNLEVVALADVRDHPLPVQLIFVNWDTANIIERFDYGICRLSFDGVTITRPPEYDEDREARVFRLRRDRPTAVSMRGSIHRYARLSSEKYQGWTWWPFVQPSGWALNHD
jgi:hypothetical protein